MTAVMVTGGVPFYKPNKANGRYLTPASFTTSPGPAPVCWQHWADDVYTFKHAAQWLIAADGVAFFHVLDLTQPEELRAYELIKKGMVKLSHGVGATPEETRAAVAAWQSHGAPLRLERPARFESVGHWSYTANAPNYEQDAVKVLLRL